MGFCDFGGVTNARALIKSSIMDGCTAFGCYLSQQGGLISLPLVTGLETLCSLPIYVGTATFLAQSGMNMVLVALFLFITIFCLCYRF